MSYRGHILKKERGKLTVEGLIKELEKYPKSKEVCVHDYCEGATPINEVVFEPPYEQEGEDTEVVLIIPYF